MTLIKKLALVVVSLSLVSVSSMSSAKPFTPKKPVELIIPAGQGGGADEIARLVQGVIEKNDYAPKPVIPINKTGGSGGVAMTYVKKKAGDEHTIMITLNNVLTTPSNQPELGIDFFNDFSPLARLITDTFLVWIAKQGNLVMGGTDSMSEDELVLGMMRSQFGFDAKYVPYSGGGAVAKGLVGGETDFTVNNPSEQMGFYQAGDSKALVMMTPERNSAFPEVPSSYELGYPDLEYYMMRAFMAPAGVDAEVRDYYTGLLHTVYHDDEFQTFNIEDGKLMSWLEGYGLKDFLEVEYNKHAEIIKAFEK
jgi:putative tricarboxylic transport membrane protein